MGNTKISDQVIVLRPESHANDEFSKKFSLTLLSVKRFVDRMVITKLDYI